MTQRFIITCACAVLLSALPRSADAGNPVSCHLSFDDLSFLDECYVARSKLKTPEERKLEIIDGRFGGALYLGAVPLIVNENNMSGIDLDLVTAFIYNVAMAQRKGTGYDEPFIWGAGKLHPGYGGVAFWVKGPLRPEMLFNQSASSFGRLEKELLQVRLHGDGSISAYVEDARYVQHTIRTGPVWKPDTWMHIVFLWDRSSGLSLWVNGKEEASSTGTDSWWDNQRPGLFHFPMSKAAYDEFYIFDRPLSKGEILDLYSKNEPPKETTARVDFDREAVKRLKEAFCPDTSSLPVLRPSGGSALVFRQITPERIHDEGISGWWLSDGRYECAWPHEYAIFTIILGDADFHAEKADILPPRGADVNYLTFEGNLDGVEVLKGNREGAFGREPVVVVPDNGGFFYGATVEGLGDSEIRIPFTKEWGTPPGFEGEEVNLPLSGDLRLHEVGLFNVSDKRYPERPGDRRFFIHPVPVKLDNPRYPVCLRALFPVHDRRPAVLSENPRPGPGAELTMPPMTRLNLFTERFAGKTPYEGILLDMWVSSPAEDNVLMVRVFNPAVPSQLWTHAEVRLRGFTGEPRRLRLALEFDPVFLVDGDRFWLQLLAADGLSIVTGNPEKPATVTLCPSLDPVRAETLFSFRTMQPTIMTYSKMFEYMPWRITNRFPDVDSPENFGGPFDMAYPWQAVLKVNPGDRLANIYRELVTHRYDSNRYPPEDMVFPPKKYTAPPNAPDWAVYFRDFQTWRQKIITWWRHHQRSDGQVGGGWNDDTLVFSSDHGREGGFSDMILDSPPDARILYNNVFDGFDRTNLFKGGYCRITPMDRLHNGDFVRERYKSLIYNLGDPRSAVWAMEEAWHWGKPEKTPVNYGDGTAFLFGKNVLEWYWNRKRVEEPYVLEDEEKLTATLRRASEAINDTVLWRFTEARVHTDDQSPYGSQIMHYLLNGSFGKRERGGGVYFTHVTITLGLGWLEGGGPDLARLVEYSGNDGFTVRMYSFDAFDRRVTARLYRLDPGEYSVVLRADENGDGTFETTVSEEKRRLERFGRLTVHVPPRVPVILEVKQLRRHPDPGDLPDLATSDYYVRKDGDSISVTVHNIGCAPAGRFDVTVLDGGGRVLKTVEAPPLESPADFVPRFREITISGLPERDRYRIVLDRENNIREIFEENNEVVITIE